MSYRIFLWSFLVVFTGIGTTGIAQKKTDSENQSEELGTVTWYRDYDEALNQSKLEKKPVLILFQEVPGCSTCRNYGHNVLSHPLMVEAIENFFIPLAIYNNKGGKDKEVLERYNEPSWNNPVVRIVNTQGNDLTDRVAGDYSALALANRMHQVLESTDRKIPGFLQILKNELAAINEKSVRTEYFKMYCFWNGEKHFGALDGVLSTEAGFMSHSEVVRVRFDQNRLSKKTLVAYAQKANCELIDYNGNFKVASNDSKYYLQQTNYKYLPLTDAQQTKINSLLGNGLSAKKYLSPQQVKWLMRLKKGNLKREVRFNKDFAKAWNGMG